MSNARRGLMIDISFLQTQYPMEDGVNSDLTLSPSNEIKDESVKDFEEISESSSYDCIIRVGYYRDFQF